MKILISGAGIAGFAVAHCLHLKGHQPIVLEKSPSLRDYGYMLGLIGAGYETADRMDILDDLEAVQHTPDQMIYLNAEGKEKFTIEDKAVQRLQGSDGINLMRGDIERVLYEKVADDIDLRFATTVQSIEQQDDSTRVTLSDGTVEEYDLVVGADGLHSQVRKITFGKEEHFIHFLGCYVAAYTLDRSHVPNVVPNTTYTLTEPNRSVSLVTPEAAGWSLFSCIGPSTNAATIASKMNFTRCLKEWTGTSHYFWIASQIRTKSILTRFLKFRCQL